jgi:hypothetical protein
MPLKNSATPRKTVGFGYLVFSPIAPGQMDAQFPTQDFLITHSTRKAHNQSLTPLLKT